MYYHYDNPYAPIYEDLGKTKLRQKYNYNSVRQKYNYIETVLYSYICRP